jgi:hypothetical protein
MSARLYLHLKSTSDPHVVRLHEAGALAPAEGQFARTSEIGEGSRSDWAQPDRIAVYRHRCPAGAATGTTCDMARLNMDTFEAFVVTFQDPVDGRIAAQFAAPNLEEAQAWRDRTERAVGSLAIHVFAFFTRSADSGEIICGWSCRSPQFRREQVVRP